MNLINEIATVFLLLIVINIMFVIIKNNIDRKIEKYDEENKSIFVEKINKIKNIFILILGIISFATLIDIYNIMIKDTNSYIHMFGIINFAKINIMQLNSMFIFAAGQFCIYLEILLLMLMNKKIVKNIITVVIMFIYAGLCIYRLYEPYTFYINSKKYEYINHIDIIKDFEEDNEISKDGAIKVIKEQFKVDYINNVRIELVSIDEIEDTNIKYSCDFEKFWIITFDYMRNNEIKEKACVYVDLYTGELAYLTY